MGKTVGLLLRLTRLLWSTSKIVVLDSGFCVLRGIVELRKKGVFASALIKNRRYWPKYIRGDDIKQHFENKEVGLVDCWAGELDRVKFHIHTMKELDYVMSLMSTYGTSQQMGDEQKRYTSTAGVVTFKYLEVVANHFQFWDAVDGHNSARMDPIALEETWKTTRWPLRVLQFLLAITEVNVCRVREYMFTEPEKRGDNKCSQQEFRKEFAYSLIFNTKLEEESMSPRSLRKQKHNTDNDHHKLIPLQPFQNFQGS